MEITLDDLDRQIIALLQRDGRMSAARIARTVGGVTARTVLNRINRLRQERVIFVGVILNSERVGYPAMADVMVEVTPWCLQRTARTRAAWARVSYAAARPRDGQLSIQVNASSEEELRRFVSEVVARQDGVLSVKAFMLPCLVKDITDWGLPEPVDSAQEEVVAPPFLNR